MPYIGNNLATQFQAFATQTITGDGSTGYTLDRAVANGKEILVYINNVKQEEGSGKSYTASGTTITFSEAVASTDSCYLVYMGSAQQTVTAPDASIVSGQFANSALTLPNTLTVTDGLTVSGSTPTLTMGDAGAEDTKIVFDGNAQDFHIGLDDSADSLTIGLGSTLGTTSHMVFDANGHITKPLQSCFQAHKTSASADQSTATGITVIFDTERFDQNADYNTSNGIFTAPVTGKYQFNVQVYLQQIPSNAGYFYIQLITSNDVYTNITDADAFDAEMTYYVLNISCVTDLDASDTAKVILYIQGGSTTIDIAGGGGSESNTSFGGFLVC
jgi:hypothetical protein